jgi:predicted alpha/beta-fold hydrolase
MPDGGCVALDSEISEEQLPEDAPVLILLPGLTGGSGDTYVQHAVLHAKEAGIRAIVFNSRATSDSPVTTPQFYSASFTGDLDCVVTHVAAKYPESRIFAAGWSLGANILTRYLGEQGEQSPVEAAVAMCNPFDLTVSDDNFSKGFNRIYDWNLAKSLRRIYKNHHGLFIDAAARGTKAFDPEKALRAKTIREFDDALTRVSFGWDSVDEYYAGSSSSLSIPGVKIPLLVIQAEDDPIAPVHAIPFEQLEKNESCMLILTPTGGHLGWCRSPGVLGAPWTDTALLEYFRACLELKRGAPLRRRPGDNRNPTPSRHTVVQE